MQDSTSLPALFIVGAALLLPHAASAQAQAPAAEALQRCSAIEDNEARLRCFDGLTETPDPIVAPPPEEVRPEAPPAQPVDRLTPPGDAAAPAPAPASAPAPAPAAAAAGDEQFGREQVVREDDPERLIAHIAGDFDGWSGDTLFVLDNGQVWRQAEFGRLRYRGPANPEVTIKKGFFGSYRLTVEGTNRWIRVKRVK
jgi:hypothetical protein